MIPGWDIETAPLTDAEKNLVPVFVDGLRRKVGKANAVTTRQIIARLGPNVKPRLTGARVRKIIHHIRTRRLVVNLVATSEGYYIETDPAKIREYIDSLKARAGAILDVANSYL